MMNKMNEKKLGMPIVLATATIYDDLIWFEQLLDFLSEIENLQLFLPKVQLSDGTEIEFNALYPLLEQQFAAQNYTIMLDENSTLFTSEVLAAHEIANEKINLFLTKGESQLTLDRLNDEMHTLLASQYDAFLPHEVAADYKKFLQQFHGALEEVLNHAGDEHKQKIIIVPIIVNRSIFMDEGLSNLLTLSGYKEMIDEAEEQENGTDEV